MEAVNLDIDLDVKLGFIPFQMAFWGGITTLTPGCQQHGLWRKDSRGKITPGSGVTLDSHVPNFLIQKLDLSN